MILSNEPGYYKTGAYGIRIENLQVVTPAADIPGGERPMLGFEPLTLAPLDRRLIDTVLMTAEEIAQMNAYHARVLAVVGPRLDGEARAWLQEACAPL
jgi:Xaa-Pro aminopeptidase